MTITSFILLGMQNSQKLSGNLGYWLFTFIKILLSQVYLMTWMVYHLISSMVYHLILSMVYHLILSMTCFLIFCLHHVGTGHAQFSFPCESAGITRKTGTMSEDSFSVKETEYDGIWLQRHQVRAINIKRENKFWTKSVLEQKHWLYKAIIKDPYLDG